jgi:hypothetical protein
MNYNCSSHGLENYNRIKAKKMKVHHVYNRICREKFLFHTKN